MLITNYKFCHIPKTAGHSLLDLLLPNTNLSHNICDKKKIPEFLFAFTRNPYNRFLSAFYFLQNGGINDRDKQEYTQFIGDYSISEFIFSDRLIYAIQNQQHFKPQHVWIPNGADFVGKVESIQQDIDKLSKIILLTSTNIPKKNITKYDHILTNKEKDIIYEMYSEDFLRFGYNR